MSVLAIACSIVGFILLVLCLMDLPWDIVYDKIKECLPRRQKEMGNKELNSKSNQNHEANQDGRNTTANKVSGAPLVTSEEEMLKRFRNAMQQSKSRSRAQSSLSPMP